MGKRKGSLADDNHAKSRQDSWQMIFNTLVNMVEDQQRKIESFAIERKTLKRRIQSIHDRWVFEVKHLEDHTAQMRRGSKIEDTTGYYEAVKANLIISMKQKAAIMHKLNFEAADDERADLKLLFDKLSQCLAEPKRVTRSNNKDVYESALKAERDFAWNQFTKADNKLQEVRKKAKSEVEAANSKVLKLINDLEQSQLSDMEKNRTISRLQDDIVLLEIESRKKSEEISRLTKELELLKGDSNRSITPVLRQCRVTSNKSHSSDLAISEKGVRSLKRKASETEPRLFTSNFKVPKLKN